MRTRKFLAVPERSSRTSEWVAGAAGIELPDASCSSRLSVKDSKCEGLELLARLNNRLRYHLWPVQRIWRKFCSPAGSEGYLTNALEFSLAKKPAKPRDF